MDRKKKIVIGVTALFAVLAGIFIFVGVRMGKSAGKKESYKLEKMEPLTFQGAVEPKRNQEVYVDASLGRLKSTKVKDGQKVKKGDVLLTYVNETVEGQMKEQKRQLKRAQSGIQSAQNALDRARSKLYRIENDLYRAKRKARRAGGSVNDDPTVSSLKAERDAQAEAVETQKDAVRTAVADRDDAQAALDDSSKEHYEKVKAKISGKVRVNEAGRDNSTEPYLTVYSKGVVVDASASEYDYPYLEEEKEVDIYVNSTEKTVKGSISHVDELAIEKTNGQAAGGVSYGFLVTPDENLQYGFSVQVEVPLDEIRIPEEYVIEEDGDYYVFRYEGESAVKEPVSLEKREGYYVVADDGEEVGGKESSSKKEKSDSAKEKGSSAAKEDRKESAEDGKEAGAASKAGKETTKAAADTAGGKENEQGTDGQMSEKETGGQEILHKVVLKEGEILILPDDTLKSGDRVVIADDKAEQN